MLSEICPLQPPSAGGWKQAGNPGILQGAVRSSTWFVPLACAVVLAHGCLDPQPEAPARGPEAGGPSGASATSNASSAGDVATATQGSNAATNTTTTGGLDSGSAGAMEPGPDTGAGGQAGASAVDQGGAPNGE